METQKASHYSMMTGNRFFRLGTHLRVGVAPIGHAQLALRADLEDIGRAGLKAGDGHAIPHVFTDHLFRPVFHNTVPVPGPMTHHVILCVTANQVMRDALVVLRCNKCLWIRRSRLCLALFQSRGNGSRMCLVSARIRCNKQAISLCQIPKDARFSPFTLQQPPRGATEPPLSSYPIASDAREGRFPRISFRRIQRQLGLLASSPARRDADALSLAQVSSDATRLRCQWHQFI